MFELFYISKNGGFRLLSWYLNVLERRIFPKLKMMPLYNPATQESTGFIFGSEQISRIYYCLDCWFGEQVLLIVLLSLFLLWTNSMYCTGIYFVNVEQI